MTRFAFITGANGGIGKALCAGFSDSGYAVIASDFGPECHAPCVHYIDLDLAKLPWEKHLQQELTNRLSKILADEGLHVLVNNAATQRLAHTSAMSIDEFNTTLTVNVSAPFLLTQVCLPHLQKNRGSVINIGSIHAQLTKPRFAAYATSKAAIDGLTRALAIDLGDSIRVNSINPAAIATDMLTDGFASNPEGYRALQSYHPAQRIGTPEEIAQLALFLADPEKAGFITGASIDISGGIHARLHDPD